MLYNITVMDSTDKEYKRLRSAAQRVQHDTLQQNIYYSHTFGRLEYYESLVNEIAALTHKEVDILLGEAGVKSPFELLEESIRHWDHTLSFEGVPTDAELVYRLSKEFGARVTRAHTDYVPTDEAKLLTPSVDEKERSKPHDANRVVEALMVLLHTHILGQIIRLENVRIFLGDIPEGSSRKRAYWVLAIENYRIAVLVNNQAYNRTFVVSYSDEADLKTLAGQTKETLKEDTEHIIYHFEYLNPNQFIQDLGLAIEHVVEGKKIKKMDAEYWTDTENIKKDLHAFADAAELQSPEELNSSNFQKQTVNCSNGESINGRKYLCRAAVALKIARNAHEAVADLVAVINELKKIAGFKFEEIKTYPTMDAEYYTKENVEKDLNAFVEKIDTKSEVHSIKQLTTKNIDGIEILCANGELLKGSVYIARAGKAFGVADTAKNARKNGAVVLKLLKKLIGLEVGDTTIHPEMNADYFTPENVIADMNALCKAGDIDSVEELNTLTMSALPKALCRNGELVNGQTYLYRAGKALKFGATGRQATAERGAILRQLKRLYGLTVEEPKKYKKMDAEYFCKENVLYDLQQFAAHADPVTTVAELNINKMASAKRIIASNDESVPHDTYIKRAGISLGMAASSRESNKILGAILTKLKEIAL